MGSAALENDLEVLLLLLNFSSYCVGIIPLFHGEKFFFMKGFIASSFGIGKSFNLLLKADAQDRRKLGITY